MALATWNSVLLPIQAYVHTTAHTASATEAAPDNVDRSDNGSKSLITAIEL